MKKWISYLFILLTITFLSSCGDEEPMEDEELVDANDLIYGFWKLQTTTLSECTNPDAETIVTHSESPCVDQQSGNCSYSTLCLRTNNRFILFSQDYEEFAIDKTVLGSFTRTDNTIQLCPDDDDCLSEETFGLELKIGEDGTITNQFLTLITENVPSTEQSLCNFTRLYQKFDPAFHRATVYIPFENTALDYFGNCLLSGRSWIGYTEGYLNRAGDFSEISVNYSNTSFHRDNAFSVAFWALDTDDTDGLRTIMSCGDFSIEMENDFLFFGIKHVSDGLTIGQGNFTGISASKWDHYVCTYDSGMASVYMNGNVIGSFEIGDNDLGLVEEAFVIADILDGGNAWSGYLDELYIFDYAISVDEVREIYQQ